MKRFLVSISFGLLCVVSTTKLAFAKDELPVKWTPKVGEVIKLLAVVADKPDNVGRFVTFTFEALKQCRDLSVFGQLYTKDDVQLGLVAFVQKFDVPAGQKYMDKQFVPYQQGAYIVLDKVFCR